MSKVKVSQLINNNGNAAANQFILSYPSKVVFQSYETIIAEQHHDGKIVIDTRAMGYSNTTSKHLYIFLGMDRKEIQQGLNNGSIKAKDLN